MAGSRERKHASKCLPLGTALQVLDPEQHRRFVDAYLALPVDLSSCVFVATANSEAGIPPALLDRLEVIRLSGYTLEEKVRCLAT